MISAGEISIGASFDSTPAEEGLKNLVTKARTAASEIKETFKSVGQDVGQGQGTTTAGGRYTRPDRNWDLAALARQRQEERDESKKIREQERRDKEVDRSWDRSNLAQQRQEERQATRTAIEEQRRLARERIVDASDRGGGTPGFLRGFGRIASGFFLLREVESIAKAENQYNIEKVIAQGDQRKLLHAELNKKEAIAKGVIGGAIDLIEDNTGVGKASLYQSIASADEQDKFTDQVSGYRSYSRGLREKAYVETAGDAYTRQRRNLEVQRDEERNQAIAERNKLAGEANELRKTRNADATLQLQAVTRRGVYTKFNEAGEEESAKAMARASAQKTANNAAYSDTLAKLDSGLNDNLGSIDTRYAGETSIADRSMATERAKIVARARAVRYASLGLPLLGADAIRPVQESELLAAPPELRNEMRAGFNDENAAQRNQIRKQQAEKWIGWGANINSDIALANNQPLAARRAQEQGARDTKLATAPFWEKPFVALANYVDQQSRAAVDARNIAAETARAVSSTTVAQDLLNRNPLKARQDQIQASADERIKAIGNDDDTQGLRKSIQDSADAQKKLAVRSFNEDSASINLSLSGRAKALSTLLADPKNTVGAEVISLTNSAKESAVGLLQSDRPEQAIGSLKLGVQSLQLQQRDYLNSFRLEQYDTRLLSGQGANDSEDPGNALAAIRDSIKELQTIIAQGIKDGFNDTSTN